MIRLLKYYFLGFVFLNAAHSSEPLLEDKLYAKAYPLEDERELKINIEIGLSKFIIGSGKSDYVYSYEIVRSSKAENPENKIKYKIIDNVGYLDIKSHEESSIKLDNFRSEEWVLNFTDKIPISFDIEIGAGKGTLDFTNLKVKDLNISAGAGSVKIMFNKPNPQVIENINIESGVSRFRAYNLSNANFNYLKFSGGLGSYELDFSGKLEKEVDVDVEIGMGTVAISIPKYIGVKITREENWLSSFDIDDEIEGKNLEYTTQNYYDVKGKINFRIKSGVGTVKVRLLK